MGLRAEAPIGPESAFITDVMLQARYRWVETAGQRDHGVSLHYHLGVALRYSIGTRPFEV